VPRFTFRSEDLKRGLGMAKIVKPRPENKDFCFQFRHGKLVIFSYDQRRYARIEVPCGDSDVTDPQYASHEYYILADQTALFDSDLETVSFSVNDKSLGVRASGDGQERKASLKRRSPRSRRPAIPEVPDCLSPSEVDCVALDQLLRQVSCSAQVKETKTEEDMRINQVHFYPDHGCATSSARYFGTVAYMDGMSLDLSIVSSDIPSIKSFCGKLEGETVNLAQDDRALYVMDPGGGSLLSLSRVASKKPPLYLLDDDGFEVEIGVDQEKLSKSLGWAALAIEGTQRMRIRADRGPDGADGTLEFHGLGQELSQIPVRFLRGGRIDADFPVRYLFSISRFVEGETVIRYHHAKSPTVMGISQREWDGPVRATHYLQSMRER
jgi:hypothetical protein